MKTILIIDDDIVFTETLSGILKSKGYHVIVKDNGGDALKLLESKQPDLIVLDCILPGVNGISVIEHVKKSAVFKHIPIVAVSEKCTAQKISSVINTGADRYFSKPELDDRVILAEIEILTKDSTRNI